MKIAKKLSFLGVLAALALAGCGQTPTSSDSSQDQVKIQVKKLVQNHKHHLVQNHNL